MSAPEPPTAAALGRLGGSLYADHVRDRPTRILVRGWAVACQCSAEGPDPACEVGFALDKMRQAENRRFDDGRRPR